MGDSDSITFSVNDVTPRIDVGSFTTMPASRHVRSCFLDKDIQKLVRDACSHSDDMTLLKTASGISHPLVDAASTAFDKHLPFTLRTQHIWIAIAHAIASHVEQNAELLRDRMVAHEGKMELKLDVTEAAVAGFSRAHWAAAIKDMEALIREKTLPGVVDKLACTTADFSNTTAIERVASAMVVMDTSKSYFDFKMETCCGFPSITLEGTVEDWERLRSKAIDTIQALTLPDFADAWLPALLSVIDRLICARRTGVADVPFWESMVKRGGTTGSGSRTWISGWINVLFPTFRAGKAKNPFCVPFVGGDQYGHYVASRWPGGSPVPNQMGLEIDDFPNGLSSAPVTLDGHPLEFRAGFIGVSKHGDGLTPTLGWFVASGASSRTKGQFGEDVVDIETANEINARIGTKITLEPFVYARTGTK